MTCLAIVGASGVVGRKVIDVLDDRKVPFDTLKLLTSARSAGQHVTVRDKQIRYEELTEDSFKGVDFAIFDVPDEVSAHFVPFARNAGCVAIDNSGAFRLHHTVPLIVPEINAHALKRHKGIVANPNCTTAIALMALAPLRDRFGLKQVKATTYQSVSGAGQLGIDELQREVHEYLKGVPFTPQVFPHAIFGNVIPQVGTFLPSGYTTEEEKLPLEGAKILDLREFKISARCSRVPVFTSHSIDMMVVCEDKVSVEDARDCLESARGIEVLDDPKNSRYPTPLDASGKYNCVVGGIRLNNAFANAIDVFVSGDQQLKGAALNAVQILELLLQL